MAHRILFIEDSADIQDYGSAVLGDAGFEVVCASTAAEARKLYDQAMPDLALVDVGLPDASGLDLLKEWQARPGRKPPMIFMSGREDLSLRIECFRAGAQDYVIKPCAAEELVARVNVHLKLKESQDELAKRADELELVARARQDMADMIVHDLKAPLASIRGTVQLVLARGLITQDNYSALLAQAGSAADFMLLMVNDLLDVAQAQHTALKTAPVPMDVAGLLEKLRMLFAARFETARVELAVSASPACGTVVADQNLLYRALANLIMNARKASSMGGKVEVDARVAGPALRFTVADRGPGVPDAEKKKIFEKYVTGGLKGRELESGTGLGLAFCRLAAEAMKGKVWVEDRGGGGSLFIVEIPFKPLSSPSSARK